MQLVLESNLAEAFRSCVEVGADGLGMSRRDVLKAVAGGSTSDVAVVGKGGPDITFTIPDAISDDLRSAFVVGWEGLDEDDALFEAADEVARKLGVTGAMPSP